MPRWIYQAPYSLLDLLGAIAVVLVARFILPVVFEYSFMFHPQNPSISWVEIVEMVLVLLMLVFIASKIIEPLRKRLSKKS